MKLCFLTLCFFLYNMANSQVVPHVKYTSKDGLIADRITSITQDENGMMWFGSYFGICRYNGQFFEKINLPPQQQHKFVSSILPQENSMYAGFYFKGGFIHYAKGKSKPFSVNSGSVNNLDITQIASGAEKSVLIIAYNKIFSLKDHSIKLLADLEILLSRSVYVNDLVQADKTTIWVGTPQGLVVLKLHNGTYQFFEMLFPNQAISNMYKDPKQRVWLTVKGESTTIYLCDKVKEQINIKPILHNNNIAPVPYESFTANSFWGIDAVKGLFQLFDNGNVQYYPLVLDLHSFSSSIFSDRENNVWVANDPGVVKITLQNTRNYFFEELSAAGGHIISLKNGGQLVTNSKNVYLIKNQQIKKLPEFRTNKDAGYVANFMETTTGEVIMSRWDHGLWQFRLHNDQLQKYFFLEEYNGHKIGSAAFAKDQNGNVWASGYDNLYLIKNKKIVQETSLYQIIGMNLQITALAIDPKNKRVFIGGNNNGLFQIKYLLQRNNKVSYTLEKHFTAKDGLTDEHIRSMLFDTRGFLWAGTRFGGIFKISPDSSKNVITNYNSKHGLSCTRVTGIAEERDRSVWFATCDGVHRYFYNGTWEHYDVSSGLPSAEIFSVAVDTANKISWAVTTQGVSAINYSVQPYKAPEPLINFTDIQVLGQKDTAALFFATEKVKYPSSKNSISFYFSGSSFIDEKQVRYKYILEGYNDTWSDPTANNNVTYASLPAGDYVFKVIASNAQGTWSKTPAVFRFQIVQPFYKSGWFIILVILIIATALYLIQNYRLRQKVKLEKLRLHIARDLHDDIGSALGSINILTKTATRRLQHSTTNDDIIGTFEKIGSSAQSTLESMDDIIWAINPEKDNWEDLLIRMKEFAIPLAESKNIQVSMDVHADDYQRLPMQVRRNIFLIFKESINNIVKHSGCETICVASGIKNNVFHLKITDDGKGFDVHKQTNRNGLKNLQQRAVLVNGRLHIASAPTTGTTVTFECPIR